MCVIIDLDAVCLICLQPNKEMHSVFTNEVDSSELQIAQKISILSELKIDQNNHTLPSKICAKCLQDLKAAWRFRKNCQAAVTIFQTIVSMDVEQPGEVDVSQDLAEEKIKREDQTIERKAEKSTNDTQRGKKAVVEEYVIVNEKDNSTVFEEMRPDEYEEESEEFRTLEGIGETNEEDMEQSGVDDENSLVEYYLNEDGTAEEVSIKVESASVSDSTSRQTKNRKINEENYSNHSKIAELLAKINKPIRRGRPRKSTKQQADEEQPTNEASLQNSKKMIIKAQKEDVKSTECKTKTQKISQVRQVKSRKRKSLSPETKPPKICEICGNSYRFQHALNAHMRRHYNDKPFPCEFCDKAFVSNVELRRHIRVHTGQKPYACQYCERRFSDYGSRIKHERTHTGERPYACGTCGKSFAYPHVLSVHLRTHTGEKRFRCDYCSKGFTKKVYLQSHVEQHHIGPNNYENLTDETTNDCQVKCILKTEYINEEAIEDNSEYEEEENQETDKTPSRIQFEMESNDEVDDNENDDNEESIHEIVEVLPDEYTIRVG